MVGLLYLLGWLHQAPYSKMLSISANYKRIIMKLLGVSLGLLSREANEDSAKENVKICHQWRRQDLV